MMNTEIIKSKMDIVPFYGGVLGTSPNESQCELLRSAGVMTVIAACYKEPEADVEGNIRKTGMEYLHFPLNRKMALREEMNEKTMRLYPKFCELIDRGECYVFGMMEGFVSLLTYWLFHGADKDVPLHRLFAFPDGLRAFFRVESSLHVQIPRVANSMQEFFVKNNLSALPEEVFRMRLKRINGDFPTGTYSFLVISHDSICGRYQVALKGEEVAGWIEEPNRNHNDWVYSVDYKDCSTTGNAITVEEARKVFFDVVYQKSTPEEYYRLYMWEGCKTNENSDRGMLLWLEHHCPEAFETEVDKILKRGQGRADGNRQAGREE